METTKWEEYGVASGNPKCANCMVSCGYEPTAVIDGFGSLKGFWGMVRGTFSKYKDPHAQKLLQDWQPEHLLLVIPGTTPSPAPLRLPAILAAGAPPRTVPREAWEVRRASADFLDPRLIPAEPFFDL